MTDEENIQNDEENVQKDEVVQNDEENVQDDEVVQNDVATEKEGNFFTKQSTPVKAIIAIVAICCIGAIILVALGMTMPGVLNFNVGFHTETVGSHTFKIPAGFDKINSTSQGSAEIAIFGNSSDDMIRISSLNQDALEELSATYSQISGDNATKVNINGNPAYKFSTTVSGYPSDIFIMNIDGKTVVIETSGSFSDSQKFVADML